jgi:hypothetical protein
MHLKCTAATLRHKSLALACHMSQRRQFRVLDDALLVPELGAAKLVDKVLVI